MRARENPFRSERLAALGFRHPTTSLEAIAARADALGRRAAIVGPHGSGKTTLLAALARHFEGAGMRVHRAFVNADTPASIARTRADATPALGPRDVLVFDGAGHLARLAWWRVRRRARHAGGLVVTAHAPGLLPTLLTTATDTPLARTLVQELAGRAAPGLLPLTDELMDVHGGNLHGVLLALYDLAARDDPRVAPPSGSAPSLA